MKLVVFKLWISAIQIIRLDFHRANKPVQSFQSAETYTDFSIHRLSRLLGFTRVSLIGIFNLIHKHQRSSDID